MNPTSISRSLTARQDSDRHMGESPRGLDIDVRVDESNAKRCVATVTLCDEFSGVHGISPAGVLFAAMERLATQIPAILRGDTSNVWVLRNAAITHFRPGCPNEVVMLFGFIEWDGIPGEPIVIHTEACDGTDGLLAEADYTIVPVSMKRFQRGSSIPLATGSFEIPRAIVPDGRAD